MKRFLTALVFSFFALPITAANMTRVAQVVDSHTIVVSGGTVVTLRGVAVPAEEEQAAAEYLHYLIGTAPVYVENGDVYRSPDALYINGEMAKHAWQSAHHETYLGELDLGPRTTSTRTPAPPKQRTPQRMPPPQRHHYPRVRVKK